MAFQSAVTDKVNGRTHYFILYIWIPLTFCRKVRILFFLNQPVALFYAIIHKMVFVCLEIYAYIGLFKNSLKLPWLITHKENLKADKEKAI